MPANPSTTADNEVDRTLLALIDLLQRGRRLRAELTAQLQASEITDTQLLVLWLCRNAARSNAGLPQHEITDALALSPAQTSTTLEQLRRNGWLSSFRPEEDRRRQYWRLTEQGRTQLDATLNSLNDWATGEQEAPTDAPQLRLYRGNVVEPAEDVL